MKKLVAFLLLLSLIDIRAENWLQNGDFTDGSEHWRGDGRTPADMAPSDPFAKPDPLLSKGLIIPLKDREWTKITQNFRTKASELVFTVTFIFSPGLTLSDRSDDYVNIPKQIDNNLYLAFDLDKDQIMALFTDFGNGAKGVYYKFEPKLGTSDPQTFRADVTQLSPLEDEVVTIAFPPGQGNVIIQSVTLEGH